MQRYSQITKITAAATTAFVLATAAVFFLLAAYSAYEPQAAYGQATSTPFTIEQSIAGGISFSAQPTDVVMDTTIDGVAGGTANGTSTFDITTNNAAGYTVNMFFSSTTAMKNNANDSVIANYTPASGGTADYNFAIPTNAGEFGYSVLAPTVADHDDVFENSGADCSLSGSADYQQCWYGTANAEDVVPLIVTDDSGTDETSHVLFRVGLDGNSGIESGTYTATATLTAILN